MKKIQRDLTDVVSLEEKKAILRELQQEDLLNLFTKKFQHGYKPIEAKKATLDQQISLSIAQAEKEYIGKELAEIKRLGSPASISSFIRNRSVMQVDIADWYNKAVEGLRVLTSEDYNEKELTKQKNRYLRLIDNIEDDKETEFIYIKRLEEINHRLEEVKRTKPRRNLRLTGRVTFGEANVIRWRAARLSLSVADYMRFVIFGYLPFSDADKHMTIDARKRFYISIIEIHKNGWGEPPVVNECPNCARHLHDISVLREQLQRYKTLVGE